MRLNMNKDEFITGIVNWFNKFAEQHNLTVDKVPGDDISFESEGSRYLKKGGKFPIAIARSADNTVSCQLHNVYGKHSVTIRDGSNVMTLSFTEVNDEYHLGNISIDGDSTADTCGQVVTVLDILEDITDLEKEANHS